MITIAVQVSWGESDNITAIEGCNNIDSDLTLKQGLIQCLFNGVSQLGCQRYVLADLTFVEFITRFFFSFVFFFFFFLFAFVSVFCYRISYR